MRHTRTKQQQTPIAIGYTMEEAAEAVSVGRTRIYAAVKNGSLKARKFGRRTIILREDLETFARNLPSK